MPYIGNPIYQAAFVVDQFSGNGSTTAFTMSVAPAGVTNVLVAVSGVLQDPSTYGVVGNTITFSAAPPSGTGNISCRYLGVPASGVTTTAYRTVTEFTATASQTTFTPPSYNVGFINVYLNGVLLGSADYTATNGTTVVLATGASAGNLVTVESFQISSVANAISNSAGAINLAGTLISGTLPVANGGTGVTTSTGSGSNVLSTSPTLVTPSLGTPSAINLSNATALPRTALPIGCVLQIVQTVNTAAFTTTSTSYVTLMTVSITPSSASNKVLITFGTNGGTNGDVMHGYVAIFRNSTQLFQGDAAGSRRGATSVINTATQQQFYYGGTFLDSPATTSAISYTIQVLSSNGATLYINRSARDTDLLAYDGRSVSSVTVMEIAA